MDELQSPKMQWVVYICDAFCENACTKMDNDKFYGLNMTSNPRKTNRKIQFD